MYGGVRRWRHLHRSELDTPADGVGAPQVERGGGRGLPADGLPVGRLERLEVVGRGGVVELAHLALEEDERVAHEEVRDVAREHAVDALVDQPLVRGLVEGRVDVVVLARGREGVLAALVVADIHGDRVVARLGQRPPPAARHALRVDALVGLELRGVEQPRDGDAVAAAQAAHVEAGAAQVRGARLLLGRAVVHGARDDVPAHVLPRDI